MRVKRSMGLLHSNTFIIGYMFHISSTETLKHCFILPSWSCKITYLVICHTAQYGLLSYLRANNANQPTQN